jgi:transcriptional regulator with XRE-family HTH domain
VMLRIELADAKALRERLGMSRVACSLAYRPAAVGITLKANQALLAKVIGVNTQTVSRWRRDGESDR